MSNPETDATDPAIRSAPNERTRRWVTAVILVASVIGSMVHQYGPIFRWKGAVLQEIKPRLWEWYIEDAAISFSFARNWAAGDGWVAFAGHERVEGFTNASWTFLMGLFYLVGIDGFTSSKFMGMAFGGATILLVWRIAVEVIDDDDSWAPLFAPVLLACFPNFAFWNASGLENSIYNFFLAGGLWRTFVEAKRGGFPWAAAWYAGLAMSRPDGLLYAAAAGFYAMVASLSAGRGVLPTVKWLLLFFVPFGAFEAATYSYFSWWNPNTYYAKMLSDKVVWLNFNVQGMKYIRNWSYESGAGWFVPVFIAGLTGLRGWRRWVALAGTCLIAVGLLYPSAPMTEAWESWPKELPIFDGWNEVRTGLLYGTVLILPLITLLGPRGGPRVLLWTSGLFTLFFIIYSSGDWMKGFRWMSFASIPIAVLLTLGIEEIASLMQRVFGRSARPGWSTPGWVVAALLLIAPLPGFFQHSAWFFGKRETGPFSVRKRVDYTDWVLDRLFVKDRQTRNLDVDMGAHTYWSPTQMVDMAGLVDVSVAHHTHKQRAFTQEYLFKEKKPEVAHVHGGWASKSRVPTFAEWKRDYVEIPGFPVSERTNHMGHHVRRELMLTPEWMGTPGREVPFADGLALAGFDVPSAEVSQGKAFYLEVGVRYTRLEERERFRVLGFLSNASGALFSFDLPPAYDWVPPPEWRTGEVFTGRFAFMLPEDLEPGTYDLGFVLVGADGRLIEVPTEPAERGKVRTVPLPEGVVVGGRDEVPARFMNGEVRFNNVLTIGPAGTGEAAAEADRDEAIRLANSGDCDGAKVAWAHAWKHLPRATQWQTDQRAIVGERIASCLVEAAKSAPDWRDAARWLEEARYWDRTVNGLWDVADRVGGTLYERGMAAREREDWEAAYASFDGAVRADSRRSWARRYAEEARDHRLGLIEQPEAVTATKDEPKAPPEPEPEVGGEGE